MAPNRYQRRRKRMAMVITVFAVLALAATVIIPAIIAIRGT
jgi:cytochrome c-type biogenesis protein CcmE